MKWLNAGLVQFSICILVSLFKCRSLFVTNFNSLASAVVPINRSKSGIEFPDFLSATFSLTKSSNASSMRITSNRLFILSISTICFLSVRKHTTTLLHNLCHRAALARLRRAPKLLFESYCGLTSALGGLGLSEGIGFKFVVLKRRLKLLYLLQCIRTWYIQLFLNLNATTDCHISVKYVAPGWPGF